MKSILSEKNIVVILFIMVVITFSFAQEDSKKIEQLYSGVQAQNASQLLVKFEEKPSADKPAPLLNAIIR
jgi:hypothetical protein